MSPDSIPQISLGTAALVIFAVCAAYVMLRGMTRVFIGSLVLALSLWGAFRVWQWAPSFSHAWFGRSIDFVTLVLPIAAFLFSWITLRAIAAAVASPIGKRAETNRDSERPSLIPRLARGLLLALVPTTLVCLIGAAIIHHTGAVAEVRAYSEHSLGIEGATPAKFSESLKSAVRTVIPAPLIGFLDPMADPSRLKLAKLITSRAGSPLEPVLDPATGEPIPRAIIVDDPELQQLARDGKYSTLLRHPLLTRSLDDPRVRSFLEDLRL